MAAEKISMTMPIYHAHKIYAFIQLYPNRTPWRYTNVVLLLLLLLLVFSGTLQLQSSAFVIGCRL